VQNCDKTRETRNFAKGADAHLKSQSPSYAAGFAAYITLALMPQVRCPKVCFYSPEDEASFFAWAQRIPGVSRVFGEGPEIVLVVRSANPSETTLRELLALLPRYGVTLGQLRQFASERNARWFNDTRGFWYAEVFGK
jgi:hypothetical protein